MNSHIIVNSTNGTVYTLPSDSIYITGRTVRLRGDSEFGVYITEEEKQRLNNLLSTKQSKGRVLLED